jgi:cytoskeletal protein RodZ
MWEGGVNLGYDADNQFESRRFEKRQKRRKINKILNLLIGLVVLLIIFFGWKLLFSDEPAQTVSTESTQQTTESIDESKGEQGEPEETEKAAESDEELDETDSEVEPESDEHATVTAGEPDSNIIRSIENSAWKPIGTEQSGSHTVNYEDGSTDRKEMEKAISYALGLEESEMIVWWLARDGENKVAGTIATKDNQHIYRVYISWLEGDGWKPTKIEELRENDSPAYSE